MPPGGYAPPAKTGTDGTAIASFVLGLVSLFILGIILGIIAVVLGTNAKKKIAASGGMVGGQGLATAGQILGVIGIVASVLWILYIFGR